MERKQVEATTETKQNIMDAYWQLYSSDNVNRITVKMITDRAGYNRGTFYAYFLDIEDLQTQIEEELLPSEENFKKLKDATLAKNSQQILEIFMQMDELLGEKLSFLLSPRGSLSFQNKLKNTLKRLIVKHLPLDLNEPARIVDYKTDLLCGIFYETLLYWYGKGKDIFTIEEMTALIMEPIFHGLAQK